MTRGPGRIDYRRELNEPQYRAVTASAEDALVLAGAGSGKTRTLVYRVAWLLESGVPPYALLLLTFTNKAAREMLERVRDLLGLNTFDLWGGTFHSICARILRMYGSRGGIESNFTILDREDQNHLLKTVISEIGPRNDGEYGKFPKPEVVAGVLSFARNKREPLADVVERDYGHLAGFLGDFERIDLEYRDRKMSRNLFDFDDLLSRCLDFLRDCPDAADSLRGRFQHILVDEYQDTNKLQAELILELTGKRNRLMVVGDDAQGIYSWRGANHRNILDFGSQFPGSKTHAIDINYRSTPEILAVANDVISRNTTNFPKALRAARPSLGTLPEAHTLHRTSDEARFVADRIVSLLERGVERSEIAVLYRAHYQSMEVQMALTAREVKFQVLSGIKFFEQAHIKDMAAFMRFVCNPLDEVSFRRMVQHLEGVGPATVGKLWSQWMERAPGTLTEYSEIWATLPVPSRAKAEWKQLGYVLDEMVDENGPVPPADMLRSVLEGVYDDRMKAQFTNYESRRQDADQFLRHAAKYEDAGAFLTELALVGGGDETNDRDPDQVTLSSIHQAKGLEWRHVFLIGLSDGAFPSRRTLESGSVESLEEERRLFYVAVTRACDELIMTIPRITMTFWSGETWNPPSRFLTELSPGLTKGVNHS